MGRGLKERTVDFLERDIDRQNGESDPGVDQRDLDSNRAEQQEIERLLDNASEGLRPGIDRAVKSERDLPHENTRRR